MSNVATIASATCTVCGGTSRYWFSKNGHDLHRCTRCRLLFVHPVPATVERIYDQDYFCGATHGHGYGDYDADKQADPAFGKYLDVLERARPEKGRLLDVGAATGRFVEAAAARGWKAAGVEVSDYAAGQGRERGLDVKTGILQEQHYPDAAFDVVTMWDVFEHVGDPHTVLDEVRRILSKGGLLALNLPDAGSTYARLVGKRWQLIVPPEHLVLYNPRNLSFVLKRHGFDVQQVRRIGKSFRPSYVAQVLSTVRGSAGLKRLATRLRGSKIDKLSLPINARDNMFVLACAR